MKVIFLDIDGVLQPLGIHHLDSYLADTTYFVSRYERFQDDDNTTGMEKWNAWMPIVQSLYDKLKAFYPPERSGWFWKGVDERTAEIREYLDRHPEITSFVALDDRNLEKGLLGLLSRRITVYLRTTCRNASSFSI